MIFHIIFYCNIVCKNILCDGGLIVNRLELKILLRLFVKHSSFLGSVSNSMKFIFQIFSSGQNSVTSELAQKAESVLEKSKRVETEEAKRNADKQQELDEYNALMDQIHQVSISSTFYARVFCMKVHFYCQNFLQKLYFGFEIFGAKILYENCAQKTLMKLTTVR